MTFEEAFPGQYNMCRVIAIPHGFPQGFCNPPKPFRAFLCDWFNPWCGEYDSWEDCQKHLIEFIKQKTYYTSENVTYLVTTSFGRCFTIEEK